MIPRLATLGVSGLLLLATAASAADAPRAGDKAADFSLPSLGGETVSLHDQLAKGPVVLVVLRGYPGYQCPLCTRQVAEFSAQANAIRATGARVVMVYPGPADDLAKRADEFLKGKTLPDGFTLLLDPDYTFTNRYGLRWDAPKETAYPSTFVIDRDGMVRFAKVSKTHGGRSSAKEVVDALAKTGKR